MRKVFLIQNLDCANCAAKIEAKIQKIPGVEEAILTFATGQLHITAENPDELLPAMQAAAESIEREAKIVQRGKTTVQESHPSHSHQHEDGDCCCGYDHHRHENGDCCGHDHHHDHHHHHADEVFTSWGRETAHKYTDEELDFIVKTLSETNAYGTVLRAKGIVAMTDGSWKQFDLVPEESEVREGQADYTSRICVIGTDLKEADLAKLFSI